MQEDKNRPIIIKRIKRIKGSGHHGGSWKIAYADFVTAMMAFFLIMWILSMLNKSQLKSVAEYFKNPQNVGLVDHGTRVNKEQKEDFYLEKGKEKSTWKDVNKDKDKNKNNNINQETKKEDSKVKVEQQDVKIPSKTIPPSSDTLAKLREMKKNLETKIANDPNLRQYQNHLNFIITADGLKIVIKDLENKPMFSTGKTDFEKYAAPLLSFLSSELNKYPNQLVIIGHTDTVKYTGDQYTNWELSSDRASATRRALIKYGMSKDKIIRIIGESDRVLLDPINGENPANRRIDIIVLTDEAVKRMNN